MLVRTQRTLTRVAVLLAGLALLVALVGTSTPSSATPAAADLDVAPVGTTAPSVPLRLVTGDMLRVAEGPDGQPGVAFAGEEARSQKGQSYLRYVDPDGDLHVVPDAALPYLGDQLDAELFAASALIRAGIGTSPTDGVPVVVAFTDGPVDVPGLTVTSSMPELDRAVGVIDADGAGRFGAALAALDGAGFFPGVDRLWLDDGSEPSSGDAPTTGQQSAVTIEVIPPDDGPDLGGWVAVLGLDSGTFEVYDVEPGAMTLELELADGRYSVSFYGLRQPSGPEVRIYTVTEPQVEVTGPVDVTLDVRKTIEATYEVDADPAEVSLDVTTVRFGDVGSSAVSWSALFFDNMRAFLAPTDPVSSGTFDQVVAWARPGRRRVLHAAGRHLRLHPRGPALRPRPGGPGRDHEPLRARRRRAVLHRAVRLHGRWWRVRDHPERCAGYAYRCRDRGRRDDLGPGRDGPRCLDHVRPAGDRPRGRHVDRRGLGHPTDPTRRSGRSQERAAGPVRR